MTINKYCQVCKKIVLLEDYDETTVCSECNTILAKQMKAEVAEVKLPSVNDDTKQINKYCNECKRLVSLTVYGNTTPCPQCGSILAKQSKTTMTGSTVINSSLSNSAHQSPEYLLKSSGYKEKARSVKVIARVVILFVALASITYRIAETPSMIENTGIENTSHKFANKEFIDLIGFNCSFEKNTVASIENEYEKIAVFSGEVKSINGFKDMFHIYVEILNKAGEVLDKKDEMLQRAGKFKIIILPDLPTRRHAQTCRIATFKSWNKDDIKFTSSNGTESELFMM